MFICHHSGFAHTSEKAHSEDLPEDWNRSQVTPENVRLHAVDGMPTCSYCLVQFKNWQNLYMHLLQSRCRVLAEQPFDSSPQPASAAAATWPFVRNLDVIALIRKQGLQPLRGQTDVLQELRHHCCLCRQWFVHVDYASSHYKKTHRVQWQALGTRVRALVRPCVLQDCSMRPWWDTWFWWWMEICDVMMLLHLIWLQLGTTVTLSAIATWLASTERVQSDDLWMCMSSEGVSFFS